MLDPLRGQSRQRRGTLRSTALLFAIAGVTAFLPDGASYAAGVADWPTYLYSNAHNSQNAAATAITTANASTIVQKWQWSVPTITGRTSNYIVSTPIVYNGKLYVGTGTGYFYALDATTGAELWHADLGYSNPCTKPGRSGIQDGISSTAAIAVDPVSSQTTVYVTSPPLTGGGGGIFLNALNADTGAQLYRVTVTTLAGAYPYASPVVAAGRVYVGIGSRCDQPQIRGGLSSFDQHTGALLHRYWTVTSSQKGGAIWTTATTTTSATYVWITTGEGASDSFSIVRLNGSTLAKIERWKSGTFTQDYDWGASPQLFNAVVNGTLRSLVGACHKNGYYYVLRRTSLTSGYVWRYKMGIATASGPNACLNTGAFDATNNILIVGGNQTTIGGQTVAGSLRRFNPGSGAVIWSKSMPGNVLGTPTMNGSGVLAAATYNINTVANNVAILINASSGATLKTINTADPVFGQPVFADNFLYLATQDNGLFAYGLP